MEFKGNSTEKTIFLLFMMMFGMDTNENLVTAVAGMIYVIIRLMIGLLTTKVLLDF